MDNLFAASDGAPAGQGGDDPPALDVFEARLVGRRRTDWRGLFRGVRRLKAITYSSSVTALMAVVDLFGEMEVLWPLQGAVRGAARDGCAWMTA